MVGQPTWLLLLVLLSSEEGSAWDYKKNGNDWGQEGVCGFSSTKQSPIDLPDTAPRNLVDMMFLKYPKLGQIPIYNNGYSIAMTMPELYKAGFGVNKGPKELSKPGAEAYRLWQVNFHSPSEHTLRNKQMPLEIQFMHKRVTGAPGKFSELAVVVVLFDGAGNADNLFLDTVIGSGLPSKAWEETKTSATDLLDFGSILGGSPFYSYTGSLTIPPCERHVKYYVRKEGVPASASQLKLFQDTLKSADSPNGNFRATQAGVRHIDIVASVDLINDPGHFAQDKAHPAHARPSAARARMPTNAVEAACMGDEFEAIWNSRERIKTTDSKLLADAKTDFHARSMALRATRNMVMNKEREYRSLQSMYDAAPGLVEKMRLKWQTLNSKALYEKQQQSLDGDERALKVAKRKLEDTAINECVARHKKAAAARASAGTLEDNGTIVEYPYPTPLVALPDGIDNSPFAVTAVSAPVIGSFPTRKIAPNLRQIDLPPSGQNTNAVTPTAKPVVAPGDVILRLKLPLSPRDVSADTSGLVNALATTGHVNASRISVKRINTGSVQDVIKWKWNSGPYAVSKSSSFLSSQLAPIDSLK